jgi:large subunit ribosomal protein L10
MPTAEKIELVRELSGQLESAKGLYLADFTGMDVSKLSLLRKRCRESQIQFRVLKNTLIRRAMNERGIASLDDFLAGPTALVFGTGDEVAAARVLADFAKEHESPRIKAALVEGKVYDAAQIKRLASLPRREELLGMVLATIIAPMTHFLGAVDATLRLPAVMVDVLERERQKG